MAEMKSEPECIDLKYWMFKLVESGPLLLVCVQGYRGYVDGGGNLHCWQSSPIVDILNPKLLVSATGRRYRLLGRIDRDEAAINKYSHAVVKAFKSGFPPNWNELLVNEHERLKADDTLNTSLLSSAEDINTTLSSMNTTMNIADGGEGEVAQPSGSKKVEKRAKREPSCDAHSAHDDEEREVKPKIEQQQGEAKVVKLKTTKEEPMVLRRLSRSGRLIKPRLQAWASERIVYDIDGNPISAHSVTTKPVNEGDSAEKMAVICEELGVSNLEPSKQSYNRPIALPPAARGSKRARKGQKPAQRRGSTGTGKLKKRQLVNYSSSSSSESGDSFLDFIDSVSLSPTPSPTRQQQPEFDDGLTPIPLKRGLNRRLITSPTTPFHPKPPKRVKKEEGSVQGTRKKTHKEPGHSRVDKPNKAATKSQLKPPKTTARKALVSSPSTASTSSDETIVARRKANGKTKAKRAAVAAPKRTTRARQPIAKAVKKDGLKAAIDSGSRLAESFDDETHTTAMAPPLRTALPKKGKRWSGEEVKRLKVALKAAQNPKSAEDWELIARSVSSTNGQRGGEECKKHAVEVLKWKPPDGKPKKGDDGSESESTDGSPPPPALEVPSSGYRRAAKKSVGGADFFAPPTQTAGMKKGKGCKENTRPLMFPESFSSLELSGDDSLLSALRSPEEKIRNIRKPFIPKVLNTTSLLMGRASLGTASNTSQ